MLRGFKGIETRRELAMRSIELGNKQKLIEELNKVLEQWVSMPCLNPFPTRPSQGITGTAQHRRCAQRAMFALLRAHLSTVRLQERKQHACAQLCLPHSLC